MSERNLIDNQVPLEKIQGCLKDLKNQILRVIQAILIPLQKVIDLKLSTSLSHLIDSHLFNHTSNQDLNRLIPLRDLPQRLKEQTKDCSLQPLHSSTELTHLLPKWTYMMI